MMKSSILMRQLQDQVSLLSSRAELMSTITKAATDATFSSTTLFMFKLVCNAF